MQFLEQITYMGIEKEQFGLTIKRFLKDRNMTQKELANALGVTAATVSFLLSNKLRTTPDTFDRIMEYIRADAFEMKKLRQLWLQTQPGEGRNDENLNLFSIRCAQGLTLSEVSSATGIDIERLRYLENKAGAEPTAEESARLRGFYGQKPDSLDESEDEFTQSSKVAEELAEEIISGKISLPVLSLDVFARASKSGTLENFLGDLPFNNELFEVGPEHQKRAKAVLICHADEIHYGFPGTLQLLLADAAPEFPDQLHLGKGARGGFALWQKKNRSWHYFGAEHPAPRLANAWSVPVLEMKFSAVPFTIISEKNQ